MTAFRGGQHVLRKSSTAVNLAKTATHLSYCSWVRAVYILAKISVTDHCDHKASGGHTLASLLAT